MLVLKLVKLLFTINTEKINSLCVKRQLPLHAKRQLPLHVRWSPMHVKRWSPLPPGSTVLIASMSIPPGSTEVIAFSCESESWLLIIYKVIINPPGSTEVIAFSHESESWLLMVYNKWHSSCGKVLADSDLHI